MGNTPVPERALENDSAVPADVAAELARAASIYRKARWPAHHRANPRLRPSLDAAWMPYLEGSGTRDEALTTLMQLAGT